MGDTVLVDGDRAMFLPPFGAATVIVQPGTLRASGPAKIGGAKVCIAGDEASVSQPGCTYMTPVHSIPGSGTLTISALAGDQLAATSNGGAKRLMVKGSQFTAKFSVTAPAMQPPPGPGSPVPDPVSEYSGQGSFVSLDTSVKAG